MEPYRFEPLNTAGRAYALPPSTGILAQVAAPALGGMGLMLILACGLRMPALPMAAIAGWSAGLLVTAWWPRRPRWVWWALLTMGTSQFGFLIYLCLDIDARGDACILMMLTLLALLSIAQIADSVRALRSPPDYEPQQPRGFEVQPVQDATSARGLPARMDQNDDPAPRSAQE